MDQFAFEGVLQTRQSISDFYSHLNEISSNFPIPVSEYQIWLGKHLPKCELEKHSKKPNCTINSDDYEWVVKEALRLFGIPEDMIEKAYSVMPDKHLHVDLEVKNGEERPQNVNMPAEKINEFDHLHSLYYTSRTRKSWCSICYRPYYLLQWYQSLKDLDLPIKIYEGIKNSRFLKGFTESVKIGDPLVFVHTEDLEFETFIKISRTVVKYLGVKSYRMSKGFDNPPEQKPNLGREERIVEGSGRDC